MVIDYVAFHFASKVVLESKRQVDYVSRNFRVRRKKLFCLYTGFNEEKYKNSRSTLQPPIECTELVDQKFSFILFRGKSNQESGLPLIINAARRVSSNVYFVIHSDKSYVNLPENILLISRYLPAEELSWLYLNSIAVLGQISLNPRLNKTLPHKLFEAAYFSKCYISPPNLGILEFMDEQSFAEVNPLSVKELADKIDKLFENPSAATKFGAKLKAKYLQSSSQSALARQFRYIAEV